MKLVYIYVNNMEIIKNTFGRREAKKCGIVYNKWWSSEKRTKEKKKLSNEVNPSSGNDDIWRASNLY